MSNPCNSCIKRRNDCILILSIVLILAIIVGVWFLTRVEGDTVTVFVDGVPVATYPLFQNREEVIHSQDGGINILVIEDGKAYVKSANCPGGDCVGYGKIQWVGQTITCQPHGVVIRIDGESQGPDIVS